MNAFPKILFRAKGVERRKSLPAGPGELNARPSDTPCRLDLSGLHDSLMKTMKFGPEWPGLWALWSNLSVMTGLLPVTHDLPTPKRPQGRSSPGAEAAS